MSLRERFAALRASVEQRAPPVVAARGKAKRLQLRIPDELRLQLAVIKMAEGGSTNKFCEAQIADGAAIWALLNYRFGFRLGGTDEVEQELYGLGFGFADVVKALMPFSFALAMICSYQFASLVVA